MTLDFLLNAVVVVLAFYGCVRLISDRNDKQKRAAILWVLSREPDGMLTLDICSITGVSRSSIYAHLATLEIQGFIMRTQDPAWPSRARYHFVGKIIVEKQL